MPYGGKLNPAVFGVWQKDLIHPTLQKPQAHLDSYMFSPFMLKPVYIGGGGRQALALSAAHLFTFISMVWRNLMSIQKSSAEHLFGGLFQIAESCSRPVAISMWEIKGVHYSLEGRKTVLRESLWLPLSAFSPATVTGADSGCFFL